MLEEIYLSHEVTKNRVIADDTIAEIHEILDTRYSLEHAPKLR